jgi:RNA polymerase sigma-70 factor, ECF subfamily
MSDGVEHTAVLLALYDDAVGEVFGYLLHRCRDREVAHDLTADTFLAALGQTRRGVVDEVTVSWLIGIARHKLLDHWRRQNRDKANAAGPDDLDTTCLDDPWDVVIDAHRVGAVLDVLGPHHRAALTLRYLDGLPVADVAVLLDRTLHATEALLVRSRAAFRLAYERSEQ